MDTPHSSVPFDPDFDADTDGQTAEHHSQRPQLASIESSGTSPVLTFYLGLACSVLVFGLVGIVWMLVLLS